MSSTMQSIFKRRIGMQTHRRPLVQRSKIQSVTKMGVYLINSVLQNDQTVTTIHNSSVFLDSSLFVLYENTIFFSKRMVVKEVRT